MDFIQTLVSNFEKLRNKDVVNILWRELIGQERSEDYVDQIIEYSFHYPVDIEAYLKELLTKFDVLDKELLRNIDGHLKAYVITFLYYCTKCTDRRVSMKTTILASILYLKLALLPSVGKIFFDRSMFKVQLVTCLCIAKEDTIADEHKMVLVKILRHYATQQCLEPVLLKGVANTIVGVLMLMTKQEINDVRSVDPVALTCMKALKKIVMHEHDNFRLKCVFSSLFSCLRNYATECGYNERTAVPIIIIFIRDILQDELDPEKFDCLMEAFVIPWGYEDFKSYESAIRIMKTFKVHYYKALVRRMVEYTQLKSHRKYWINITQLLSHILKNLPEFPIKKISVFYSCAVRNILQLFMEKDKLITDHAVDLITEICCLRNNPLVDEMFNRIECTGKFINISVEALFLSFVKIIDERWTASAKNHSLLIIFAKFLSHTRNIHFDLFQKTLKAICKDSTPHSLKASLGVLQSLFCVAASRGDIPVARAVLMVIFNNAMHPDPSSKEFLNHIIKYMLEPSIVYGEPYSQKYYCNIFLTSDFEYEALFVRCQRQIGNEQIKKAISNLDFHEDGSAVLLCCLLDYYSYTDINALATYVIDNFAVLCEFKSVGYICMALNKILKNRAVTPVDYPQLDQIQSLIMVAIFQQSLPVPSIKPAYSLYKTIRSILQLPPEEEQLNTLLSLSSEKALRRLHTREVGDNSVIMYLNEICLLLRKLPTANVLNLLERYMDNHGTASAIKKHMPDIYLQLLMLFTTIGMMNKSRAPLVTKFLVDALKDDERIVKVAAVKLLFSLCQEITHEFEQIIDFSFKQMIKLDPCLVRICSTILEQLIHEDYIKLDSEEFFKFVYTLGCEDLTIFTRDLLMKRFMLSNHNDVARFYIQTIAYMNLCTTLSEYPISDQFHEDLIRIKLHISNPREIITFLFQTLPIRKKFNIIGEISRILDNVVNGQIKASDNFFNALLQFIDVIKFMKTTRAQLPSKNYYRYICRQIETQIIKHDPEYNIENYYTEYEAQIRQCTLVLFKLLFFENEQLASRIQIPLFDTLMHWLDFIKPEIIHYIHVERNLEYIPYLTKFVKYYKRNNYLLDINV